MLDLLAVAYPWTKSLHVISMVAWMAGLFYLPRLFVHHVEQARGDIRMIGVFQMMESKLLRTIMTPAMIATWVFGSLLAMTPGIVDWSEIWPWMKAVAVLTMTWFHTWCARQRKLAAVDMPPLPGRAYRIMNEVPTVLLIVIVIAVIARPF